MMTTNNIILLNIISQQITVILGIPMIIFGVVGGVLSILVFLSLRMFRENPSGVYLTMMSLVNIGNLLTGLLSRILMSGFGIDWTTKSSIYCKLRWYGLQFCVLTSFTCVCLTAVDQYFATHVHRGWRKFSNIKYAPRFVTLFVVIWFFHGFFYFVFFDLSKSPTTGETVCHTVNPIFAKYHTYGYLITLAGLLPLIIMSIFGTLAIHNIQNQLHRPMSLFRREVDKQLTKMIFNHFIHNFVVTLPYTILMIVVSIVGNVQDQFSSVSLNFVHVLSILIYYSTASVMSNFKSCLWTSYCFFHVESILYLFGFIRKISTPS